MVGETTLHGTIKPRRVLAPSEAATRLIESRKARKDLTTARVGELKQQISAYTAKQRKSRTATGVQPTPERLAKGDLATRPVHGPDGFVASVNYDRKRVDVVSRFAKSWAPEIVKAFEQFAADANVLEVRNVTINYAAASIGGSRSREMNKTGGVGDSHKRRMALQRHEFLLQELRDHFDGVPNTVPVADVLNFVLCHVEAERLKHKGALPQTVAELGRRFVSDYKDDVSCAFIVRGALEMVGRFMATFYLKHWATYGALYKRDAVA